MNEIYDHAPECDVSIWLERAIETDAPRWLGVPDDVACQCVKLRACEQRVLSVAGPHNYSRGRKDGYAAGLAAARDAVKQMCHQYPFIWPTDNASMEALDELLDGLDKP